MVVRAFLIVVVGLSACTFDEDVATDTDGGRDTPYDGGLHPTDAGEWRASRILRQADGLFRPDGLGTTADGRLLLCNEGLGQLLVIDVDVPSIEVLVDTNHGLSTPEEVAVAASGTIFVSDDASSAVFRIDDGEATVVVGAADGLVSPEGIVVLRDDTLIVADESTKRITAFLNGRGPGLHLATETDGVFAPEGMAKDARDVVYVTDDVRGGVLRIDGSTVDVFLTPDELGAPEGVTVDGRGDLWFSDNAGAATVQRYSQDGVHLLTIEIPAEAGALGGIAALPDGRIALSVFHFANDRRHELWLIAP